MQGLFGPHARKQTEKSMPSCAETSMLKINFPVFEVKPVLSSRTFCLDTY